MQNFLLLIEESAIASALSANAVRAVEFSKRKINGPAANRQRARQRPKEDMPAELVF